MSKKPLILSLYEKTEKLLSGNERLKTFYPIRAVRRRLINYALKFKTNFVEIEGRKMFLDENDSLKLSLKNYAVNSSDFVKRNVQQGDVILDLGANIGYWTLLFSKLVGNEGIIYSFEPEPNNFAILKKNVEINECKNVVIEQKAVANKTGKIKLYLSSSTTADHKIYDSDENRNSIEIDSTSLDDYFQDKKTQVNLIKMNIQGAEAEVIKAMQTLVDRSKSLIIMSEFTPSFLIKLGMQPKDFVTKFIKSGFSVYDLNPQYEKPVTITLEEILKKYTIKNEDSTLLIFVRGKIIL